MLMAVASRYMRMFLKLLLMVRVHVHMEKIFVKVACLMFVLHYFYVSLFLEVVNSAT